MYSSDRKKALSGWLIKVTIKIAEIFVFLRSVI